MVIQNEPEPVVPGWVRWPVRVVALVFVVPVQLGWTALAAFGRYVLAPIGRFLHRYLLRPVGWFIDRCLLRPVRWFLDRVVWQPVRWLFIHLLWRPLGWLGHHLLVVPVGWLFRVCRPVLRAVGVGLLVALGWAATGLLAVAYWIGRVLRAGWEAVRPGVVLVGRVLWAAVRWAWRVVELGLGYVYRLLLRPVGRALRWLWRHTAVPIGRAVRWGWRATVAPASRWIRDAIWQPTAATTRSVLITLGLRHPGRPAQPQPPTRQP
ncbi:hypothetical protein O7627_03415 [Solwaraspora sp. WMMD1047]|uniref:hypothetical protein n=1 Tax=Solwaraspora sp. WMMD1047 TaxID=3016102 RepID=UPI002416D430|nr:hypothetical protein [Solwaraspora sp. WMMD1047]MDG4828353.1 hypothetical protein [Solwaraspora sp. WMMD1047]